ncbi:MAG: transcription termination factor Rho [Deltaproteobacteria bacterium]|nr:transcription termination factor Rho [Deltaproteobacteria bacterium]
MEEDVKKEDTEKTPEDILEKPLDKMTATELREFVLSKNLEGLTGVHAMKKEELLKAVREAMGIPDEAPPKKSKRTEGRKELDVKEIKKKIMQLKDRKKEALSNKEKKKVNVLRRRINRLKKRTKSVAKA